MPRMQSRQGPLAPDVPTPRTSIPSNRKCTVLKVSLLNHPLVIKNTMQAKPKMTQQMSKKQIRRIKRRSDPAVNAEIITNPLLKKRAKTNSYFKKRDNSLDAGNPAVPGRK